MREVMRAWLDAKALSLAPTTRSVYSSIVNHYLLPAFGHLRSRAVTEDHVTAYLAARMNLKPGSRRLHFILLKQVCTFAVRRGAMTRNPTEGVQIARVPDSAGHALPEEELIRFLAAARSSRFYVWYLMAALTGMRHAELAGLRWQDVDLDRGTLVIVQTRYRQWTKEPKTRAGRRRVALPTRLVEALRTWQNSRLSGEDLVFSHHTGRPWSTRGIVEEDLPKVLTRAGLPRIRLHDLRHTHATLLLAAGVSPHIVSQRLGHSTVAFTMQVYGHVLPGMQEEAARALEDRLFGIARVQ